MDDQKLMVQDLQNHGCYITKGGKRVDPSNVYWSEDEPREEVRENKKSNKHESREE